MTRLEKFIARGCTLYAVGNAEPVIVLANVAVEGDGVLIIQEAGHMATGTQHALRFDEARWRHGQPKLLRNGELQYALSGLETAEETRTFRRSKLRGEDRERHLARLTTYL